MYRVSIELLIETRVEVWDNKKCRENTSHRQVFPVQCFQPQASVSFRKHRNEKKKKKKKLIKKLLTLIIKM